MGKQIDYDALEDEHEPRPSKLSKGGRGSPTGSRADQQRRVEPSRNGAKKRLEDLHKAVKEVAMEGNFRLKTPTDPTTFSHQVRTYQNEKGDQAIIHLNHFSSMDEPGHFQTDIQNKDRNYDTKEFGVANVREIARRLKASGVKVLKGDRVTGVRSGRSEEVAISIDRLGKSYESELAMGKEVEREHADSVTGGEATYEKIAKDHLKEDPMYYTHLRAMENKYKKKGKGKLKKSAPLHMNISLDDVEKPPTNARGVTLMGVAKDEKGNRNYVKNSGPSELITNAVYRLMGNAPKMGTTPESSFIVSRELPNFKKVSAVGGASYAKTAPDIRQERIRSRFVTTLLGIGDSHAENIGFIDKPNGKRIYHNIDVGDNSIDITRNVSNTTERDGVDSTFEGYVKEQKDSKAYSSGGVHTEGAEGHDYIGSRQSKKDLKRFDKKVRKVGGLDNYILRNYPHMDKDDRDHYVGKINQRLGILRDKILAKALPSVVEMQKLIGGGRGVTHKGVHMEGQQAFHVKEPYTDADRAKELVANRLGRAMKIPVPRMGEVEIKDGYTGRSRKGLITKELPDFRTYNEVSNERWALRDNLPADIRNSPAQTTHTDPRYAPAIRRHAMRSALFHNFIGSADQHAANYGMIGNRALVSLDLGANALDHVPVHNLPPQSRSQPAQNIAEDAYNTSPTQDMRSRAGRIVKDNPPSLRDVFSLDTRNARRGIRQLNRIKKKHGSWEGFLAKQVPEIQDEAVRKQLAVSLERRHQNLIQGRKDQVEVREAGKRRARDPKSKIPQGIPLLET